MSKKPKFNENAAIRGSIRRMFSRSPAVIAAKNAVRREVPKYNKDGTRAKKDAVQYLCNVCKKHSKSTEIAVDHVVPVIDTNSGFVDWNTFVARLFCSPDNLQVICDSCHNSKTNAERAERQLIKDIELLNQMFMKNDLDFTKENLKKFTKKKIETYPREVVKSVEILRARIKGNSRK